MKYLTINGKKEKIPGLPHHKSSVYRIRQFMRPKSFMTHLTYGNFLALKELYRFRKNQCSIPRVLLIDPTSSCNLKCKGCWAADYKKGDNLSYEKLDEVMTECEELGILDVFFSGGEPLMRKNDILKLCRKHRKITFSAFTNATLIDETFADQIAEVKNLNMFVSIEGTREETDFRRGEGTYDKVIKAMELLKERNIGFAFSACYHSKNYKTIASKEFLDDMRKRGAWFGWLFNYVPVGQDADLSIVCTAEQRAYVYDHVSSYSDENDYMVVDFWNNGHTAFGCVAGGNGFLHINAKGEVEPCAFCHYSDSNIIDMSLIEALKSPFLTKFRASQPFSDSPFRACPMVDVPEEIKRVVKEGGAHSTHYASPESAEAFTAKTIPYAKEWEPVADELTNSLDHKKRKIHKSLLKYLKFRTKIGDQKRSSK
jgi:MoaA/NifB/PqqE/SkfB family radical SAM enzyme